MIMAAQEHKQLKDPRNMDELYRAFANADYYVRKGIDPTHIVGCNGDCSCCHAHDHEVEE